MKFLFSSSTRHLTRSLRSLVSYRVKHSKRNSISTRAIYYSLYMVIGPNLFRLSRTRIHDFVETETTRFRGNDQSGKIRTRQEPIGMPGFTSKLPCHKMNKQCLYLARKYARIFVHGHYLFQDANSFPKVKLEENCDLEEQIMFEEKNTSIFLRKIGVVFPILKMYCNTRERETLFTKSLLYKA